MATVCVPQPEHTMSTFVETSVNAFYSLQRQTSRCQRSTTCDKSMLSMIDFSQEIMTSYLPYYAFITCSTVVLQCYRRHAIPIEQAKIRPSVTLYSLDRSLSNLVWLITSATPTHMPILVKFGSVGNSPQIDEI